MLEVHGRGSIAEEEEQEVDGFGVVDEIAIQKKKTPDDMSVSE